MDTASGNPENLKAKSLEFESTIVVSDNCRVKIQLADMKVADLKAELEKRNLDKSGVKSVLIEKLKNALLEEGEDPEEFNFVDAPEIKKSKNFHKKNKIPDIETNGKLDSDEKNIEETSEVKNADDTDDKMNNEVTLQLSIDDEEAQLNEDENIIDVGKSLDEIDLRAGEEHTLAKSEEPDKTCPSPQPTSAPTTPVKTSTLNSGDKAKKVVNSPRSTKSSENNASSKLLKVINKSDKIKNVNVVAKTLWVKALSTTTRAADLKALFSKQGKVLSVKIVKSTKQTPGKCYGFITMATSADATKAVHNLHHTVLNGQTISVEQTQREPSAMLKKSESKILASNSKMPIVKKETGKKTETLKKAAVIKNKTKSIKVKSPEDSSKIKGDKTKTSQKSRSNEREVKSQKLKDRNSRPSLTHKPPVSRSRPFSFNERPRYGAFRKPYLDRAGPSGIRHRSDLSMYERMREDRFQQRIHFRERERREAERTRALELSHHRFIERKQREEALRLEKEKEKLRIEREILERERAEILKLERERQILERQRLEREREELRRQAELRQSSKRPFSRTARETEPFWEDKKKPRIEEHSSFYASKLRLGQPSGSRHELAPRERSSLRRPEIARLAAPSPRTTFSDHQPRREVTIRSREERRVYDHSNFRSVEERSRFPSRERTLARQESPRVDWKQDRRAQERIVTSRSSSSRAQRRMTYY